MGILCIQLMDWRTVSPRLVSGFKILSFRDSGTLSIDISFHIRRRDEMTSCPGLVKETDSRVPAGFQPAAAAAGSLLESSPFVKLWICDPLSECETLHQRSELSATFSRLLSPFFARNYNLNSIPGCECLEKLAHLAQNRKPKLF